MKGLPKKNHLFRKKYRKPHLDNVVEKEIPEGKEIAKLDGKFGAPQDVQEVWSLGDEDTYVHTGKRRGIPKFVIPAVVFVGIVALLFWLLPSILPRLFQNSEIALFVAPDPVRIYSSDDRMVISYASSVMQTADVKSERVTQVLFNEAVELLSSSDENGYVEIRTVDGITGYIPEKDLSDNLDSIEPDLHQYKLIVSDISKNIMSHASNGTLEIEVMMNTVLFSDQKRAGVYHVALPDGKDGWVSSSGVIELGVYDPVDMVGVRYFVSSVLSYVNMTHLEHGLTKRGLSVEGLAYISAAVNGLELPRKMEDQMQAGQEIPLQYDEITGELLIEQIAPGDLVFFRNPLNPLSNTSYEMGICTDIGMVIMISKSKTTLRLISFSDKQDLHDRIIAVRRIFE